MHKPAPAAPPDTWRHDLAQAIRGVCMGCADVIPGVSGGTVALILGIYGRLVTAISHVDLQLMGHLRGRRWREAAMHIDLRFLVTLAAGVVIGFGIMTTAMHFLLTDPLTRAMTLSAFFGMILASAVVVGLMIRTPTWAAVTRALVLGVAGAVLAYMLATLRNTSIEPTMPYLFLCGAIAICAMILPGISGAMVLLIMGVYIYLTEIPHQLAQGQDIAHGITVVLVFGAGCAIGLITFSKFLRWLLARYHPETMAVLCGFMIGALRKIWPFQRDVTPQQEDFKLKTFEVFMPQQWDSAVTWVVVSGVLAMALVFAVDWIARVLRKPTVPQ